MDLLHKTSLLLDLAMVVFSATKTPDNAVFFKNSAHIQMCPQENRAFDGLTPSLIVCAVLCSTQTACRWVGYTTEHQECFVCNDTTATETSNNETAPFGTVFYDKAGTPQCAPTDGPCMAALMEPGTRVRRGMDWLDGLEADGGAGQLGTVIDHGWRGWFTVKWDWNGKMHIHRMGAHGVYELEVIQ